MVISCVIEHNMNATDRQLDWLADRKIILPRYTTNIIGYPTVPTAYIPILEIFTHNSIWCFTEPSAEGPILLLVTNNIIGRLTIPSTEGPVLLLTQAPQIDENHKTDAYFGYLVNRHADHTEPLASSETSKEWVAVQCHTWWQHRKCISAENSLWKPEQSKSTKMLELQNWRTNKMFYFHICAPCLKTGKWEIAVSTTILLRPMALLT